MRRWFGPGLNKFQNTDEKNKWVGKTTAYLPPQSNRTTVKKMWSRQGLGVDLGEGKAYYRGGNKAPRKSRFKNYGPPLGMEDGGWGLGAEKYITERETRHQKNHDLKITVPLWGWGMGYGVRGRGLRRCFWGYAGGQGGNRDHLWKYFLWLVVCMCTDHE